MEKYLVEKHYPHLDGLRGIAILLVLLIHLYSVSIGWVGVDLFFVLSGFLITNILLKYKESFNSYKIFLIRRSLRIFPIYFLSLAFVFLIGENLFNKYITDFQILRENQIYFWTYTQNFFFTFDIPKPNTLNHFWSLAIEEQFYIIWPIIIFKFKSNVRLLLSIFIGLILLSVILKLTSNNIAVNYTLLPYRMDSLILGGVISLVVKYNMNVNLKIIIAAFLISLILFLMSGIMEGSFSHTTLWMSKIGYFAIDVFFACLILLSLSLNNFGSKLRSVLNNSILITFGKYSYGIYVIHWPAKHLIWNSGILDDLGSSLLINSTILIISLILAYCIYHLFEKRFLNLKSKFKVIN